MWHHHEPIAAKCQPPHSSGRVLFRLDKKRCIIINGPLQIAVGLTELDAFVVFEKARQRLALSASLQPQRRSLGLRHQASLFLER